MRVEPGDVLLRLEPAAHVIDNRTRAVRTAPAVELHWKDGRRWRRKTFLGTGEHRSLGAILADLGAWLDACPDLETALRELGS